MMTSPEAQDSGSDPSTQPVAITGVGAVSGWGWGVEPLWQGLVRGESATRPPEHLDTSGHRTDLAAEVPAPSDADEPFGGVQRMTWAERFALAATQGAVRQANLDADRLRTAGVFFGGSTAGMGEAEDFFARWVGARPGRPRLRDVVAHQLNGPGDAVARAFEVRGPVSHESSACASGALAVGAALDALRLGDVDVALAGGSDALCQLTYAGFNSLRAVDGAPCRPFRGDRSGLNLGEGAGVLVLETADAVERRGARPLAWLLGAGGSCDAHHMTAPHPEGRGAAAAMAAALGDAGLGPESISFVNAHGTGTPHNDIAEWHALRSVLGERAPQVPVTSTKGSVGHLLGASGALEAVATVLCLAAGQVHPTPGAGPVDPSMAVDLVLGTPRPVETPAIALSTSFAFGGANAALVFGSANRAMQGRDMRSQGEG